MCKVFDVSRSGYYDWLNRDLSERRKEDGKIKDKILEIYYNSRMTYGSPRILKELKNQGIKCGKKRVERLMQELDIQSIQKRKFKVTTNSQHELPVADNILKREFDVDKPNKSWVSDITYIYTKEGWLYLSVVMDLYSRKIIGWAMENNLNQDLVLKALTMAIGQRNPNYGLILHSDQGIQVRQEVV